MTYPSATECPEWCIGGYQCTARGHLSETLVWPTDMGRIIATRYRRRHNTVEIRLVVRLPDGERQAQRLIRHLVAAGYLMLSKVLGPARRA